MPSLRDIRRRIRGVRSTAQITKAMELVAASRMRRAQQRVLAARPYAETMRTLISELAAGITGGGGAPPAARAARGRHRRGNSADVRPWARRGAQHQHDPARVGGDPRADA